MSDAAERAKRPVMVWFISCFYIIVGIGSLAFCVVAYVAGGLQPAYFLALAATGLLTLLAAVALLLLRRQAIHLFALALAASLAMYAWNFRQPGGGMPLAGRIVSMLLGLSLMISVLLYARSLKRAGVLK